MKKHIIGAVIGLVFITTTAYAVPTSALSVDEIQSQIKTLLAKVAELQMQLKAATPVQATSTNPGIPTTSNQYRICSLLARNLSQGTRGDDVRSLQEFLQGEGYLSTNATGYFGTMTAQAVSKWQEREGVSAVGVLGPMSRERIKAWCLTGQGGGGQNERFSATPQRGSAPLTVTFRANVQVAGQGVMDAGSYKILFGDGQEQVLECSTIGFCKPPQTISHTYTVDGKYTAQLVSFGGFLSPAAPQESFVGSAQITVGSIGCTMEYSPVCGSKPIVCIRAPCNPVPQTYSNRCMMNADGATFAYEGACRDTSTNSGGGAVACTTMEYAPVCGGVPDPVCVARCSSGNVICGICAKVEKTYPNRCMLNAASATFLYSGQCSNTY